MLDYMKLSQKCCVFFPSQYKYIPNYAEYD